MRRIGRSTPGHSSLRSMSARHTTRRSSPARIRLWAWGTCRRALRCGGIRKPGTRVHVDAGRVPRYAGGLGRWFAESRVVRESETFVFLSEARTRDDRHGGVRFPRPNPCADPPRSGRRDEGSHTRAREEARKAPEVQPPTTRSCSRLRTWARCFAYSASLVRRTTTSGLTPCSRSARAASTTSAW